MAATFKQQCPSCEAMVPIRDRGLIGRKIDCPTCKYRFVVDEPADGPGDDEDDAPPAKAAKGKATASGKPGGKAPPAKTKPTGRRREEDDEDQPRAKSGEGGSTKLVVGLLAAVVGIGLIAVAVYFGFIHESGSTRPAPAPAPAPAPIASTTAPGTPPVTPPGGPQPAEGPPRLPGVGDPTQATAAQPTGDPSDVYRELTNLLPNDTEGIIHIPFRAFQATPVGRMAIGGAGAFSSKEFEARSGIRLDEVERFVQAISFRKNWTYHVLLTNQPINIGAVQKALQLKEVSPGSTDYFLAQATDWVDLLVRHKGAFAPAKLGPLAVRLHNPRTLIFGDEEPVKSFVQATGKFTQRHKGPFHPLPADPAAPGGTAGTPTPGGTGELGTGGAGGSVAQIRLPDQPTGQPEQPGQPVRPYYITVNPTLKAMLDRLEAQPTLTSMAFDLQASRGRLDKFIPTFLQLTMIAGFTAKQVEQGHVLGLAVQQLRSGLNFSAYLDTGDVESSRAQAKSLQTEAAKLAKAIEAAFGSKTTVVTNQAADPAGELGTSPGIGDGARGAPQIGVGGGGSPELGTGGGTPRIGIGGAARTGQPGEPDARASSTIEVLREERVAMLRVNLLLDDSGFRKLATLVEQHVRRMRGDQDMATGQIRWHEVGTATAEQVKQAGTFPRGTYPREAGSARAGVPYPPSQRVSWMASLLPHLGHDIRPNTEKSWQDPENLPTASILVPQFLDPRQPRSSWWVRYPGINQDVAATHIVGMAGLGVEAADYRADDPNAKGRLGVFGYDRVTKPADITDGTSHTIMMIQVPPTFKRPWLAGGGATVMGVPDPPLPSQKSVSPFVMSTSHNGKPGTMAIMADGSVRFIPADVPDDLFKAMCTIQGGDQKFLDRDVPLVKDTESTVSVRTTPVPAATTTPPKGPAAPLAWKEFTSSEGGFAVDMPGEPRNIQQAHKTPAGEIKINIFAVSRSPDETFMVMYSDYPAEFLSKVSAEAIYQGAKAGVTAMLPGSKVTRDGAITLAGQSGRELYVEVPGKGQVRNQHVLVKNRMYQVVVTGSGEFLSSPEVTRFFSSFKLLAK